MVLLQTTIPPIDVQSVNDSIKVLTEDMLYQLQNNPHDLFVQLGHQAIMFLLKVLVALLIYFIGMWIIRKVKNIQQRHFERRKTDPTVASFISSATSFALTLLTIIIAVGTLGIDTSSLAALLAAGGMAIGMALSGTVQNFAGGLMILAFRPFKVGDWISAQGYAGTVIAVAITNTKIRTIDGRLVVLPNGALSNGTIDNHSALPIRRIDLTVNVAYGTDADKCIELLLSLLKNDERILNSSTPECSDPFVGLKAFNDSDISFVVRGYVKSEDFWNVTFDLNKTIYEKLPENGIQFAYPHLDVNLLQPKI